MISLSAHWITLVKDVETGATLPKFNALNFAAVAPLSPDATLVPMPFAERAIRGEEGYVCTLAALAYQMLGGISASGSPGDTFIPIPGLSEDANLVLRRAMRPDSGSASPVKFVAALEDAMGDAPATPAKPPRLPTVVSSAVRPRSSLPLVITVVLVSLAAILIGVILLIAPRLKNAFQAGTHEAPPAQVVTSTPTPSPAPTPQPDARKVALDDAIKRAQDMAVLENYVGALGTLNDLVPLYPEAADQLKVETEKITAKLGSQTDDLLSADQLVSLGDLLEAASQRGLVSAQMLLGKSYLATDPTKAFNYFYLAATNGKNSEAMYQLGDMWASGHGVDGRDIKKAVDWFQQSARLLYPPAIYALGECYYFGKGFDGKPDYARAFDFLQLAANQYGNRYAQMLLGDLYHDGKLGGANYVEASRLWEAAAAQGLDDARTKLIVMVYNGEIVNGKPVTGKLDRDKADRKAAFEQFKESASKGNRSSMFYYAMCLMGGVPGVVEPDEAAGRKQMVIAAEHGDAQAQGWCRQNGVEFSPPH